MISELLRLRKDGESFRINFPGLRPYIYSRFNEWVLRDIIETNNPRNHERHDRKANIKLTHAELCEAWVMGDNLRAPEFQNEKLRVWNLKMASEMIWDMSEINFVWKHTTADSRLRAFLVDSWARATFSEFPKRDETKNWNITFLFEVLRARDSRSSKAVKQGAFGAAPKDFLDRDNTAFEMPGLDFVDLCNEDDVEPIVPRNKSPQNQLKRKRSTESLFVAQDEKSGSSGTTGNKVT